MSSHVTIIDIERIRGDNYPFAFQIFKADGVTPQPIAGFTLTMTVDPEPYPEDAANNIFQLNGIITDAPNGILEFRPTLAQMNITPGVYFYDIQLIDTTPYTRTPIRGQFTIEQDITKT